METNDFCIVIPCSRADSLFVHNVVAHIRRFYSNSIYIITSQINHKYLNRICKEDNLFVVDENSLLDGLEFDYVKRKLKGSKAGARPGWYFQQLLKYAFPLSEYCDSKYYLVWDSDTIPLSKISFFDNGHPLFNPKKEYHEDYFVTIKQLFDLEKNNNYSFISEHMMFDAEIVREMLSKLDSNEKLQGNTWYEKILNAVIKTGTEIAFSEFETYGTYCEANYSSYYQPRHLATFREGGYISGRMISNTILWQLSFDLDTVSFESQTKPLFPLSIISWAYINYQKTKRWFIEL